MLEGQRQYETGAPSITGIKHYITIHMTRQGTGNGETDTRAIVILIKLNELLEDMLSLFRWHTDTRIFHNKHHLFLLHIDLQGDVRQMLLVKMNL